MIVDDTDISCGIGSIRGAAGVEPEDILNEVYDFEEDGDSNKAFYIWSNRVSNKSGVKVIGTWSHKLADKINELRLGEVTTSMHATNPNTGNGICIWTWRVDREAFQNWIDKRN